MDTLTVETLAAILQEPKVALLRQVLRTMGPERCAAILADTLSCEASGGMLTKDGTRRRTPGGMFFQLVKAQATPKERQRLFYRAMPQQHKAPAPGRPPAPPQEPTWAEVQALVQTLPQGEATVKLTLIGRPALDAIQTQPTYIAFRMQGKEPGPLPKGLPPVPDQHPIAWLVVIALRQWNRVKDSLAAHADDTLIIEGHPVVAGEGTHVLLAQTCTSMVQQRAKKQAKHPPQAEAMP
jgi:Phosphorylated adapter RNA export protein, RNA-binding domain